MKILIFRETEIKNLNPVVASTNGMGATETCVTELANALSKNNIVKVCCPCNESQVYGDVEYISFKDYSQLSTIINLFCPDIFIVTGNPRALFDRRFTNCKIIFWQHNHPDEVKHFPIHKLFSIPDLKIVFPSPEAAEIGKKRYGHEDRIHGIYNGVRLNIFSKVKEKEKNKISFCGSLTRAKGALNLLNHCNELKEYKIYICSGFDLYGAIDIEYKNSCEPLIAANENVILTGTLSPNNLSEHLASSELCIVNPVPGHKETCCVSALEAMASNTPVLSGDSSINKIILHGGEYFKGSAFELISSIKRLMNDNDKRNELAVSGKQWVQQLSWENIAKKWEDYLKNE